MQRFELLPIFLPLAVVPQGDLLDSDGRAYVTGHQIIDEAYRPSDMAVGDLNLDGHPDVVLAHDGNFIAPKISVQLGLPGGGFGPPSFLSVPGETSAIVVTDLDNDQVLDLACTLNTGNVGEGVATLLGHGDGSFAAPKTWKVGRGPSGLVALDADRDGDMDLAVANGRNGEEDISLLLNDGTATFAPRTDFATPGLRPFGIDAGDLDGDGHQDLAFSVVGGTPAASVLWGDGGGGFSVPHPLAGSGVSASPQPAILLEDLDLDGDLEVLASQDWFENLGAGQFAPPRPWPWNAEFGDARQLAVEDVTADGVPDVLAIHPSPRSNWILAAGTDSGYSSYARFAAGEDCRGIAAADLGQDGLPEVLVANAGSNTLTVHRNTTTGFSLPPRLPAGSQSRECALGDLDGNGTLDAVTLDSTVFVFLGDGFGGFQASSFAPLLSVLDKPKLHDLDQDGSLDLICLKNLQTGAPPYDVYTARGRGDGTFEDFASWGLSSAGTGDVAVLDFDSDGDPDLVITEYLGSPSSTGTQLFLLANRGDGTFDPPTTIQSFALPRSERVLTRDFDGDGILDLVTGNGDFQFWKGDGSGGFALPVSSPTLEGGTKYLASGDFDGDGVLDIASTNFGPDFLGERLVVSRGHGNGSFGPPTVIPALFSLVGSGVGGLATLDLEGDGDLDLVAGCRGAQDIALFRNRGDGTFEPEQRYGVQGGVYFVAVGDLDGDGRPDVAANTGFGPPDGSWWTIVRNMSGGSFESFCTSLPNSTGQPARIDATGTASVSANDLVLRAAPCPASTVGLFFYGAAETALPFGHGLRCVAGGSASLYRLTPGVATPTGVLVHPLDLSQPHASGGAVFPGATWKFQAWFRDPAAGAPGFNLSDGLSVQFVD